MIPTIHQDLHILALGPRGLAEDRSDAPGFLAALAAQDDSPSPPTTAVTAEACLAAGMVMPTQPILQTPPILAAGPVLTAPPISPPDAAATYPTAVVPTELSPSALTSAPTVPQTTPISTTLPLVLTPENKPQPTTFGAVEIPAVSISKPDLPLTTGEPSAPITSPEKPRHTAPAEAITRPVNAPIPIPTPTPPPQNASALVGKSIAAPTVIIAKTSVAAAALAPQITAAEIIAPAQTADQPTNKPTRLNHPAMTLAPLRAEATAPPLQAFPAHVLAAQTPEDPIQVPPPPPVPEQPRSSISPAESAWQTRLQVAVPLKVRPKPNTSPDRMRVDARGPKTDSPKVDTSPSASAPPEIHSIDLKLFSSPNPSENVALSPQAADSPTLQAPLADITPPQQSAEPASIRSSPAMTPKPTPDAAVTPNPPPASSDQTLLQPPPDQLPPRANPALQPISPHQTVQTQALLPSLATAVPAQFLHHAAAAAKTGGVDVLLQPEELGHVKFQIQQHGETVRILLSAERPETLDLLRRHSDQLLQEFRQSGFSQASLNFGQWGQQQKSPMPQPELAALFDADIVEAHPTSRLLPAPAAAPSGQGLNLRL